MRDGRSRLPYYIPILPKLFLRSQHSVGGFGALSQSEGPAQILISPYLKHPTAGSLRLRISNKSTQERLIPVRGMDRHLQRPQGEGRVERDQATACFVEGHNGRQGRQITGIRKEWAGTAAESKLLVLSPKASSRTAVIAQPRRDAFQLWRAKVSPPDL